MQTDDSLILIYTALAKPQYRRGLFDAISYPFGHVVGYSYRKQNIHPSLLQCACRIEGRAGLIIYVDQDPEKKVTYFPVRFVTVHRLEESLGSISRLTERERIHLPLRLEGFVTYEDGKDKMQWHETVSRFDKVREITERPRYFVIPGRDGFGTDSRSLVAWEDLVKKLSESSGLQNGVFLRLDHLKEERGLMGDVERTLKKDRLVYQLRPARTYRLDFSVFEPPTRSEREITVKTSAAELLTIDQPHQATVSGLVEKSVLITTKRTIENTLATISVTVKDEDGSPKRINSPNPRIYVQISPPIATLIFFLALVFFGSFLASADSDMAKQLFGPDLHLVWLWAGKGLGALLLVGAAYLAFRRLPSGS